MKRPAHIGKFANCLVLSVFASSFAGLVQAKTIALWPIEFDEGSVGLSSVGSLTTPLTQGSQVSAVVLDSAPGVPSLYDDSCVGGDVTNRSCSAKSASVCKSGYHYVEPDFGARYCSHTNEAYTIEGYFTINKLPAAGDWALFIGSQYRKDVDNLFRWHISLAPEKAGVHFGYKPCWGADSTSVFTPYLTAAELGRLTNGWNHFAFTYRKDDGAGQAWSRFYLNGTLMIDDHRQAATPEASGVSPWGALDFGGVSHSGKYSIAGAYDYIRISDAALEPCEFLNAAELPSGEQTATIAYWKLDWTADGLLNTRPSVGSRQLNGLMPGVREKDLMTSSDMDFVNDMDAGMPSNLAMDPQPTGSTSNKGCLWLHGKNPTVSRSGLGAALALTNSFTVECWLKRADDPDWPNRSQTVFMTSSGAGGWKLSLERLADDSCHLHVRAYDGDTPVADADISGVLRDLYSWHHVALAYDRDVENGVWSLYVDGNLKGTAANSQAPTAAPAADTLTIGAETTSGFRGYMDYVRVCRAALSPSQLLNAAEDATPATGVFALWPLDVYVDDGVRFDGRDAAAGLYPLAHVRAGDVYRVTKSEAGVPQIRCPDKSAGFVGDPSTVSGSVEFRVSSSVGSHSYLMSTDPAILALLNSRESYTIECFVRRNAETPKTDDAEAYLFGSYCNVKGNDVTATSLVTYRLGPGYNGFCTYDRIWQGKGSGVLSTFEKPSKIENPRWHHVAWQREFIDSTTARYTLWLDGRKIGTADETASSISTYKATAFFVGGRTDEKEKQWMGGVSSVRVSNAILRPEEFLNGGPSGAALIVR